MVSLNAHQKALKEKFLEVDSWSPAWEAVLLQDPTYFEAYTNWALVPVNNRRLPPKIQQLIHIGINAAATYGPNVVETRAHIAQALASGASEAEIMEVLQLASVVGIHACNIGIPILLEVLEEKGIKSDRKPLNEYTSRLKEDFIQNRGYWHPLWEDLLHLDPKFFEGYINFSSVPWKTGVLEPKVKELVYCAFDCASTHMYKPGLKLHMQNVIRYNGTAEEVMEVLEIASLLGVSAVTVGAPMIKEEAAKIKK